MTDYLSPAVQNALRFRMDAAHGEPTVWEKVSAWFGGGGANRAATLAGEQRDFSAAEQEFLTIFQPVLHTVESVGITDLSAFLKTVLSAAPSITSISGAVDIVKAALETAVGSIKTQATSLGQTSLITLVSAILAALGHVNLPVIA